MAIPLRVIAGKADDPVLSADDDVLLSVMRGLDPRIHPLLQKSLVRRLMDCRVKPGNDGLRPLALAHT
jgi:hypothetical protein